MALIDTISIIEGIHGKMDGSENLVFTKRYGNTHAWEVTPSSKPATEKQIAMQTKFTNTTALVKTEMADPQKKAEWQTIADNSNGKWKTARGACFAALYKNAE